MQTSRFQLGLIATLAVGLGFSLASSEAIGYPAGAVVSVGTNPVVSKGGSLSSGSDAILLTAPADQDIVVTDLVMSSYSDMGCKRTHYTNLYVDSGVLGNFETNSAYAYRHYDYDSGDGEILSHRFVSGLKVPAGETLTLSVAQTGASGSCGSTGSYGVRYSVSGYLATP